MVTILRLSWDDRMWWLLSVNYTCIGLDIHLMRNIGYYLTQTYIPSVLVVILSWVNFWLSVDAVPARISLGLLTVLTMTTQSSNAVRGLTVVSYVKAMDVWVFACLFFVFAGLLEFAWVNVSNRVESRRKSITDLPSLMNGHKTVSKIHLAPYWKYCHFNLSFQYRCDAHNHKITVSPRCCQAVVLTYCLK